MARPEQASGISGFDITFSSLELGPLDEEVLKHLATGLSNREIAMALGKPASTVEYHIHTLYLKFGIKGRHPMARHELVRLGIKLDYLPPDTDLSKLEPSFFTPRETDVFQLVVSGKKTPEITTILGITQNRVKKHRQTILGKLGVGSTVELMIKAFSEGWVDNSFVENLKNEFAPEIARLADLSPEEYKELAELTNGAKRQVNATPILKKLGVKNRRKAALVYLLATYEGKDEKQSLRT